MEKKIFTLKESLLHSGFPGGRNGFEKFLKKKRILLPNGDPDQKFIDSDWFYFKEELVSSSNGDTKKVRKLFVTQYGMDRLKDLVRKEMGWIMDKIMKYGNYR